MISAFSGLFLPSLTDLQKLLKVPCTVSSNEKTVIHGFWPVTKVMPIRGSYNLVLHHLIRKSLSPDHMTVVKDAAILHQNLSAHDITTYLVSHRVPRFNCWQRKFPTKTKELNDTFICLYFCCFVGIWSIPRQWTAKTIQQLEKRFVYVCAC